MARVSVELPLEHRASAFWKTSWVLRKGCRDNWEHRRALRLLIVMCRCESLGRLRKAACHTLSRLALAGAGSLIADEKAREAQRCAQESSGDLAS